MKNLFVRNFLCIFAEEKRRKDNQDYGKINHRKTLQEYGDPGRSGADGSGKKNQAANIPAPLRGNPQALPPGPGTTKAERTGWLAVGVDKGLAESMLLGHIPEQEQAAGDDGLQRIRPARGEQPGQHYRG